MNNNTKRRKAAEHKLKRKQKSFGKPVYKAKSKPFPRPNPDAALSIRDQCEMFYGACFIAPK